MKFSMTSGAKSYKIFLAVITQVTPRTNRNDNKLPGFGSLRTALGHVLREGRNCPRWNLESRNMLANSTRRDGEQSRDFTFIENIVDETLRACEAEGASGMVLNGGTDTRITDTMVTLADGTAERDAALRMASQIPGVKSVTLCGDKNYDTQELVRDLREMKVTPHVAQNANRRSAIDGRTTQHPGYAISQKKRKWIQESFGCGRWFCDAHAESEEWHSCILPMGELGGEA